MTRPSGPLPSVDEVLRCEVGRVAAARFGHAAAVAAIRADVQRRRTISSADVAAADRSTIATVIAQAAFDALDARDAPRLKRVFNMTGTVLHTNLGRAVLPENRQ